MVSSIAAVLLLLALNGWCYCNPCSINKEMPLLEFMVTVLIMILYSPTETFKALF